MVPGEKGGAGMRRKKGTSPPDPDSPAIQEAEMPDKALNIPVRTGERPSSLTPFQKRVLEETADKYDAALSALRK